MPAPNQRTRKKDPLLIRLGTNVRAARERLHLTQERLAEITDLSPRTIQKIEAGQLNILVTTLTKLGKALDRSASALLDF